MFVPTTSVESLTYWKNADRQDMRRGGLKGAGVGGSISLRR